MKKLKTTSKRTRIKRAMRKQCALVFYVSAAITAMVLTYPRDDHKTEDPAPIAASQLTLKPVSLDLTDVKRVNESGIYSI